jgi:phosphatidylglycerophosphatase A
VVGLLIALPLRDCSVTAQVLFVILFFGVGLWASGQCAAFLNQDDPSCIVVDEIHAMLWLLLCLPTSEGSVAWPWWIAALVLFRIFDIAKPPPIRRLEHLPGGFGIMMDDVMAAGYALAILWVGIILSPRLSF